MDYTNIILEKEGAVAILAINKPQSLNALSTAVIREIKSALAEVRESSDIRVLILTGKGKVFVAGSDINEMKKMGALDFRRYSEQFLEILNALHEIPIPVIAAVNGPAFGGGNILATSCDMVIASDKAKFGQQEITVGIFGGIPHMLACMGRIKAADFLFTGRIIDAQEAKELGIASRVVPQDSLMQEVKKLALEMAARNPTAMKLAKITLHKCAEMSIRSAIAYEMDLVSLCFDSQDAREGLAAFSEGRAAVYRGC